MAKKWTLMAAAVAAAALCTGGQAKAGDTIAVADLQWKEMFPGVKFALSYGDWEKGAHGKFVRIDHGTKVPLHLHSNDYHAVLISGRMANLFEGGQRTEVATGDYFYMAGKRPHAHECMTQDGCFFYTYGAEAWDIELSGAE
jgi:beta-alanine degradation protein BauB